MGKKKLTESHVDTVRQLRKEGLSIKSLAKELGVTHSTLSRFMKQNGIPTTPLSGAGLDVPAIVDAYESGKTLTELSQLYKRDVSTIRNALQRAGVTIRKKWLRRPSTGTSVDELPAEQITADYQQGATLGELSARYNAASSTISKCLDAAGVQRRGTGPKRKTAEEKLDTKLRRLYGISVDELNSLIQAQGNQCKICGVPPTDLRNHGKEMLCIDHCHATGAVRGLLCHTCNLGLSYFKDSKELFYSAGEYVCSNS